jgi:benzodiazapine receptor
MDWLQWYNALAKPAWTPAPATIGLIWKILYPIIAVTFGFVFVQTIRRRLPWMVALPFAINLAANLAFTPIQFGMRNMPLASVDIVIVWATILWSAAAAWPHHRWVALAQVPYFVWVSIATVLQLSITAMN